MYFHEKQQKHPAEVLFGRAAVDGRRSLGVPAAERAMPVPYGKALRREG